RVGHVTGVQTCALPIYAVLGLETELGPPAFLARNVERQRPVQRRLIADLDLRELLGVRAAHGGGEGDADYDVAQWLLHGGFLLRSEERRVGKECESGLA